MVFSLFQFLGQYLFFFGSFYFLSFFGSSLYGGYLVHFSTWWRILNLLINKMFCLWYIYVCVCESYHMGFSWFYSNWDRQLFGLSFFPSLLFLLLYFLIIFSWFLQKTSGHLCFWTKWFQLGFERGGFKSLFGVCCIINQNIIFYCKQEIPLNKRV